MASPLTVGNALSASGTWGRSSEHFPDPFCDAASLAMPETIQEALKWVEFIAIKQGPYREAINRVLSYFLTEIEIEGVGNKKIGREEKQKYLDFLNDTLGIINVLHTVGLDYMVYGNSFTSLMMPFRRYLACPECHIEFPLKKVMAEGGPFGFSWSGSKFNATCPHCKRSGDWRHIDRRSAEQDKIKVKRWSPHEMDILWDPYTDDTSYIWRIPDDYRTLLRKGTTFHLERASWEIIQAVQNNQALLFDKDVIYHMKENTLAGVRNRGWGLSRVLTNFGQAWYVQVLHRYNEAIALDYVIPFRVLTPMPRPGSGGDQADPVLSINMGSFVGRINQMLAKRKRDPAGWNVLPFPLDYKALGGDATQLAPKELMDQGLETLLSAIGVPVELYKGSLSVQAAPTALRLFEANWSHLVHNLNRFLAKLVDKISQIMSWEPVTCHLQRVKHADDLNRQMAQLQLMMGGQISKSTGLASVGMDFLRETQLKAEEQRTEAEVTQDVQEEMEQAAQMDALAKPQDPSGGQGAGPPPGQGQPQAQGQAQPAAGGMPPPAGAVPMGAPGMPAGGAAAQFGAQQGTQPGVPQTPEEMMAKATTLAQQIFVMPETQKDSALIQLNRQDPVMHSLVKSQLEDMKRDAKRQAEQAGMQQQQGGDPSQGQQKAAEAVEYILGGPLARNLRLSPVDLIDDRPLRRIEF